MALFKGKTRKRVRELTTKLASSPVLPILGYTKAVETVVAGGPTFRWIGYAAIVTFVWIFADDIQRRAEDLSENVQDAVDEEA